MAAPVTSIPNIARRLPLYASTLIAAAAVAACGGGSGASGASNAGGTATVQSVASDATAAISSASNDSSILALINSQAAAVRVIKTPAVIVNPGPGYFVDAVNGSDSNAGTFGAPFKTLAKLRGIALATGDGVYLACGGVWRESLTLGINAPIEHVADGVTVAGYGDCSTAKAVISGADDFSSGWTKSGNIWSRPVPTSTPKISRLFIGGVSQRTAQWPNYGGIGHEYALADISSPQSNTVLKPKAADAAMLASVDVANATLSVRAEPFAIEQVKIATLTNGALQLAGNTYYGMEGGDGYVLSDKRWMLDAPGEFYHDVANGMLYLYPADAATQANANSAKIEGSVRDNAMVFADHRSPKLSNLSLTMARVNGLSMYVAPGAVLTGVDSSHNGSTGMYIVTGALPSGFTVGTTITGSNVSDNWHLGIDAGQSTNVAISASTISDTGTLGMTASSDAGIKVGPGGVVDRSVIRSSAHAAISFSDLGGTRITNNLISDYCLRLTDCGGVYTNGTPGASNQTSLVDGNQILGATPSSEGAVDGAATLVVGLYLDDFANGVTVSNNMLMNMPTGLYVHNGSNNTITGNKFWLTTNVGLKFIMDRSGADYMTGNTVRGNQFVPTVAVSGSYPNLPFGGSSLAISFDNIVSGQSTLTSGVNLFADNQMVPLFGASMQVASAGSQQLTSDGWRGINTGEGTVGSPVAYAWYSATLGPELMTDGGFDFGVRYWQGWLQNNGLNALAQPATGIAGCTGPCMLYKAGTQGDLLLSSGFHMTAGLPHVITYTAVLGGTGTFETPFITRNSSPWDFFADSQGFATVSPRSGRAGDIVKYEAMFRPISSDTARLNLQMTTGVPVYFDSVSIRQVTSYAVPATSELVSAIYVSPSSITSTTINCATLGWPAGCQVIDTSGATVSLPATLAPGSSKLYMRTDSTWKR